MPEEKKNLTTVFRKDDLDRLKAAAGVKGLSPSSYLRMLALKELNEREERQPA